MIAERDAERDANSRAALDAELATLEADFIARVRKKNGLPPLNSPQSTARDFGAPDPTSMGLRRIVWACAVIVAGLFVGWLVTRSVQGAVVDAETARAMARAYLGGM